jgi:hypothetical protein
MTTFCESFIFSLTHRIAAVTEIISVYDRKLLKKAGQGRDFR